MNPIATSQIDSPLHRKDLASTWQGYMDTYSLMSLSSASRGTYHAYRPQLDKRIIALFGLIVPHGATHQDVMQALVQQIPKGETKLVLDECNQILSNNEHIIRSHLLKKINSMQRRDRSFQVPTSLVPFESREYLLKLLSQLWMEHADDAAWYIDSYLKTPSMIRFMRAVANNLCVQLPSCPKATQLDSIATGILLAQQNTTTWAHFKAKWNSMNIQQQAVTILGIGKVLACANIRDHNHPAVPLVKAFTENEEYIWVDNSMRDICSHIFQARIADIHGLQNTLVWPKTTILQQLLQQLSLPSANKEPIRTAISKMMQDLLQATNIDEIQAIDPVIQQRIYTAELQTETPSIEALAYMIVRYPTNEKARLAFTNLRKSWKDMNACQQAQALYVIGKTAMDFNIQDPQFPAAMLLIDFAQAELLGWKNMSMQKACVYLVQRAQGNFANGVAGDNSTIVNMFEIIADPAYNEDLDTVFRLLSDMIRSCEQQEGVHESMENWYQFTAQLAARKMDKLGFTLTNRDL